MALEIVQIPVRSNNYIYLAHETISSKTAVIDPADAAPVMQVLRQRKWRLDAILITHHHHDHIGGNHELKQEYGCNIYGYGADAARVPGIDHHLKEGDMVQLGAAQGYVLFVPGHTLGHIAYYFPADSIVFCGDVLFSLGCGRVSEGTPQQMLQSLQKLAALPDDTRVHCAHEYTLANGEFALTLEPENPALQQRMAEVRELRCQHRPTVPTTLAQEKATNPFLRTHSAEIRQKLAMPHADMLEVFTAIRHRKDKF
jgi:hydroxyacylglutathione hydrolase